MIQHNHQTAPTQFVEANGIRFAYRRFGNTGGSICRTSRGDGRGRRCGHRGECAWAPQYAARANRAQYANRTIRRD